MFPFCAFATTVQTVPPTMQSAKELYFNSKPEEALNQYIEISKRDKDKKAFLNAIYIALELAQPRLAVDTSAVAIKLFPTDTTVLEFAARAYLANGHNLHAENLFSLLNTSSHDKDDFYHIGMARAQMGMGEDKLAEQNLLQASKGSNAALANFLLGELYFKEKNYFFAAKHY
ncbi:MAG: hypothetical protein II726_00605, partial [Elusimicrobiaceae bacterium]|nr:hypothetical protein [Elusimicrobiaceae bacterium]